MRYYVIIANDEAKEANIMKKYRGSRCIICCCFIFVWFD